MEHASHRFEISQVNHLIQPVSDLRSMDLQGAAAIEKSFSFNVSSLTFTSMLR
jgi:hypothetical protein